MKLVTLDSRARDCSVTPASYGEHRCGKYFQNKPPNFLSPQSSDLWDLKVVR